MSNYLSPILRFAASSPEANFGRVGDDAFPSIGPHNDMLTEQEREERQIDVVLTESKVFDSQDPDDMKLYNEIIERRYAGWYIIYYTNMFFDAEQRYIFLIWGKQFHAQGPKDPFRTKNGFASVSNVPQTESMYAVAGDMISQIINMGKDRYEGEEEEPKKMIIYRTDSGTFDILNSDDMTKFHTVLDQIVLRKCLCDCLKVQYDQARQKIFMVWVTAEETEIEPSTNQGWE